MDTTDHLPLLPLTGLLQKHYTLCQDCQGTLRGVQMRWDAVGRDGGEHRWCNFKPRCTKRLKGELQPTFSSTPQLALITATLFKQLKVNRLRNFWHHGKNCLFGWNVIQGLTRKSLVELFCSFLSTAHTEGPDRPARLLLTHLIIRLPGRKMLKRDHAGVVNNGDLFI